EASGDVRANRLHQAARQRVDALAGARNGRELRVRDEAGLREEMRAAGVGDVSESAMTNQYAAVTGPELKRAQARVLSRHRPRPLASRSHEGHRVVGRQCGGGVQVLLDVRDASPLPCELLPVRHWASALEHREARPLSDEGPVRIDSSHVRSHSAFRSYTHGITISSDPAAPSLRGAAGSAEAPGPAACRRALPLRTRPPAGSVATRS